MENEGERKNNVVDIVDVLDFMERLKNEEDQNAVDIVDQIEELKLELAFICTYVQLYHCDLKELEDAMIELPPPEYNHRCKYRAEQIYPLESQYEILKNVSGNIKDFHGLIVNGCIEREIVEYVLPQFQLMAERVGLFLWNDRLDGDS
ncbi:hypothetical protein P3S68_015254 [Capsicum galapagoense]